MVTIINWVKNIHEMPICDSENANDITHCYLSAKRNITNSYYILNRKLGWIITMKTNNKEIPQSIPIVKRKPLMKNIYNFEWATNKCIFTDQWNEKKKKSYTKKSEPNYLFFNRNRTPVSCNAWASMVSNTKMKKKTQSAKWTQYKSNLSLVSNSTFYWHNIQIEMERGKTGVFYSFLPTQIQSVIQIKAREHTFMM